MTKEQAVKSASEQLRAIELWGKRTYHVSLVSAVFTGIVALAAVIAVVEYARLKMAVSQASKAFSEAAGRPSPFKTISK